MPGNFTLSAAQTYLSATITLTATDNISVTWYCVTQTNCTSWSSTPPTSYTYSSQESNILYAFARDAAGNISVPFGDGGNPSPLGEEKFIYCRYATLSTWSTYKE